MSRQPMQPIERDRQGVVRFRKNAIVRYLLGAATEAGVADLNRLAMMSFSDEDRQQFAQLIGYSVSGYGDLFIDDRLAVAEADCAQAAFEVRELAEADRARCWSRYAHRTSARRW